MYRQGISSNIMSLGGIAIAIGAMIDAAIIMIENTHKHIEREGGSKTHWQIIRNASIEVGPTLFYSLLVITVSFLPVFALQAQEGRLFKPLAYTKTYSMAAAALLSITLAPVLMGYLLYSHLSSGNRFRDSMALGRDSYCRASRRVGFLSVESAGYKLSAATASPDLSRDRQIVSVSKLGLGVHAAALRGRSALHAHDVSWNLHDQSTRDSAADRPDH
jgi:multidrug efflux pump subunit AcrB